MEQQDKNIPIRSLAWNRNAIDYDGPRKLGLREMVSSGICALQDLRYVLDDDSLEAFNSVYPRTPDCIGKVTSNSIRTDGHTEVYFWGLRGSGKTSVIAGLLVGNENDVHFCPTSAEEEERVKALLAAYSENGKYTLIPTSNRTDGMEIINADFIERIGGMKVLHPVSLIEMPELKFDQGESLRHYIPTITTNRYDKIHLLCFDVSARNLDKQIRYLTRVLDDLQDLKVFDTSVGLYILVTKTDSQPMVPKANRRNAAQTIITATYEDFWYKIKNLCFKMNIYDLTPLPYSLGEVLFRRVVKMDLTDARDLFQKPILLKTLRKKSLLSKMLESGNGWLTTILCLAVCGIMGWILYTDFQLTERSPETPLIPYDFVSSFQQAEQKQIKDKSYADSYADFNELESDLLAELGVRDQHENRVSPIEELNRCGQELYADFYSSVEKRIKDFLHSSNWNLKIRSELIWQCSRLQRGFFLNAASKNKLTEYKEHLEDYERAKAVIRKAYSCRSMTELELLKEDYDNFSKTYVYNDDQIRDGLKHMLPQARLVYAKSLYSRAESLYRTYRNLLSTRDGYRGTLNARRDAMSSEINELRSEINRVSSKSDDDLLALQKCDNALRQLAFY